MGEVIAVFCPKNYFNPPYEILRFDTGKVFFKCIWTLNFTINTFIIFWTVIQNISNEIL